MNAPEAQVRIGPSVSKEPAKKLIVAVHGIGDQFHYSTVQSVAAAFSMYCGQEGRPPLGGFHPVPPDTIGSLPLSEPYPEKLRGVLFAEVYWADIPRKLAASKDTIEEAKSWAQTVVQRVRALDCAVNKEPKIDYRKASTVVAEMIETIRVLENLLFIANKAGVLKFELAGLLTDYLGDVQVVAEFADSRTDIVAQFTTLMRAFSDPVKYPQLEEIHIVAHSEGTVVSFLGLMGALSKNAPDDKRWLEKLTGYMTIGSPIDKHIVMWPDLWKEFRRPDNFKRAEPIQWRNYYDYGDPVGFELDTTRDWLQENGWKREDDCTNPGDVFDFTHDHDIGFTRYPFPGKAHNDYWKDKAVFGHFIADVIERKTNVARPTTKRFPWIVSWIVPYILCLGLLGGGIYVFYKAVAKFLPEADLSGATIFKNVAALTILLAGTTLIARVPRLVKFFPWHLYAAVLFGLAVWGYNSLISAAARRDLGLFFYDRFGWNPDWSFLIAFTLVGVCAAAISALWPRGGLQPLMWMSGALAALLALDLIRHHPSHRSLWPVFLAGAAFLYLWWLAALIFDLVFVWHRYIRWSTGNKMLRAMRKTAAAS